MRGVDDHDDQPEDPPVLVVAAGNVTVLPSPNEKAEPYRKRYGSAPDKRPDYTHPPAGRYLWAALIPLIAAELIALRLDVEWTLSRTIWWILGPEHEPRWWMLGMPLLALMWWAGLHFLWPYRFGGTALLVALAVAAVVGGIGLATTR